MNSRPARLIVEGVSGAGKSQVLRRLRRRPEFRGALVLTERATFGELMGELDDRPPEPRVFLRRLDACLNRIERLPAGKPCLVERFHPSYFALVPDWRLYAAVDRRLARLGFRIAILRVPERALARRSLDRADRSRRWHDGMSDYFGGRTNALKALRLSQRRRAAAARNTALPCRTFDTRDSDWARAGRRVQAFLRS